MATRHSSLDVRSRRHSGKGKRSPGATRNAASSGRRPTDRGDQLLSAGVIEPSMESPAQVFMSLLRADHARQSRLLRKIDALAPGLRDRPQMVLPFLGEAMQYLLQYQHGHHHPREDLLFEAVGGRAPRLRAEMLDLQRQHRGGQRSIEAIVSSLEKFTPDRWHGPAGARLARSLHDYTARLRDHMRAEERVFYARSEETLGDADWNALLTRATPADPMTDAQRLRQEYPHVARLLAQVITEVPGFGGRKPGPSSASAQRLRALLERRHLELTEIYGEMIHDALDLMHGNLAFLRNPNSTGLRRALQQLVALHWHALTRTWGRTAFFATGFLHELTDLARSTHKVASTVQSGSARD